MAVPGGNINVDMSAVNEALSRRGLNIPTAPLNQMSSGSVAPTPPMPAMPSPSGGMPTPTGAMPQGPKDKEELIIQALSTALRNYTAKPKMPTM